MKIKVNRIRETTSKLFDPDGNYIGKITNFLELADVRIQIKKAKLRDYYIIWKEYCIIINDTGHLSEWPEGFYDTMDIQLDALIK